MRQFILGGNVAYGTNTDFSKLEDGAVGIFYNKDGVITSSSTGKDIIGEANIVVGRPANKGGAIVIPFYKNNFSFVKGEYQAATKFSANLTLTAPTKVGDYSIIIVKKGVKFNERNKWTAMVHIKDTSIAVNDLAKELEKRINFMSASSGVTAKASEAQLTIEAINSGEDYAVIGADELFGIKVTVSASGIPAYGSAKYVQDLAEKAAADAGFEYTYRDAYYYLYPDYPLNPLKQNDAEDAGFTIFTLKFAEPSKIKTRDDVVNQIVQVAFPTDASAIATFETVCKGLAGIE